MFCDVEKASSVDLFNGYCHASMNILSFRLFCSSVSFGLPGVIGFRRARTCYMRALVHWDDTIFWFSSVAGCDRFHQ